MTASLEEANVFMSNSVHSNLVPHSATLPRNTGHAVYDVESNKEYVFYRAHTSN